MRRLIVVMRQEEGRGGVDLEVEVAMMIVVCWEEVSSRVRHDKPGL